MKLQRLIAILTILLRVDRMSAPKLAEKFEVSVRTIYRDIAVLESAGIPIVTTTGIKGGFSILEQYKIDKKLFTSQDFSTLLTGLNSVSGSISDATLNQTLEKIRALIPDDQARNLELSANRLFVDLSPWGNNPVISANLVTLQKALEQDHVVTFTYTTLKEEVSSRKVEPHQLVLKENQWYLRGYCLEREAFRVFKLRRIREVEILSESFTPREFSQKMNDFRDWTHERMLEIELRIHPSLKEQLLDRCSEDAMTTLSDGFIHVHMNFVESDLGYGYLMQFGEKCECLAPLHIRQELARRISAMHVLYKGEGETR